MASVMTNGELRFKISWVPGWDLPPHKAFMRAITPDKPSTADMTTLIEEGFRQESRDVDEGASGQEALISCCAA